MKAGEIQTLKRLISKISYVCGSVLSEYQGTGGVAKKEKEMIEKVFVRENLSSNSKIELPYYSVDFNKKICMYHGFAGTSRLLGEGV